MWYVRKILLDYTPTVDLRKLSMYNRDVRWIPPLMPVDISLSPFTMVLSRVGLPMRGT